MKRLIVEYKEDAGTEDTIEYFACWADDEQHAKEQCEDSYPGCKVTAIFGVIKSYPET